MQSAAGIITEPIFKTRKFLQLREVWFLFSSLPVKYALQNPVKTNLAVTALIIQYIKNICENLFHLIFMSVYAWKVNELFITILKYILLNVTSCTKNMKTEISFYFSISDAFLCTVRDTQST